MQTMRIIAFLLLSPTRLVIDYLKRPGGEHGAAVLLRWNHGFFCFDIAVAIVLGISTTVASKWPIPTCLALILLALAYSRCNEVTYAFLRDANRELEHEDPTTPLPSGKRIKMAMRSYVGLLINFAVMYYFLPQCLYKPHFENFVDALYFSGVTLATLGYGDIVPVHIASKLLSLYEVLSGMLLVVVAVAVYFSGHVQKKA